MIHKPFRTILCIFIIFAVTLSILPFSSVLASTGTLVSNNGIRDVVCTDLSQQALRYYTGSYSYDTLSALPGRSSPTNSYVATVNNPLYSALHTLMANTHTFYTVYSGYTEESLATFWLKTDAEAGSDTYLYFYTDRLRSELSDTTMNREHVWPKSKASYKEMYGGADLHHLRPSIASVNSAKSDHRFVDISDTAYGRTTSNIAGKVVLEVLKDQGKVEVRDNIKGDIARILLYVYCRWEQPNLYSDVDRNYLPPLDSDDTANSGERAIEDLDTLLRWCESDPVDQWEMGRNDQTENVQGNRNVFIDYPELAWLMFGMEPPKNMPTPSGEAMEEQYDITVSVNDPAMGSATVAGKVITANPVQNCEVAGYTVLSGNATVVPNGNTFTVEATSHCHIRIEFRKKSTVTLTFTGVDAITDYVGNTITLPQGPTPPEGYTFVGWTTARVADSTSTVSYLKAGSLYTAEENTHFYGLYSHVSQSAVSNGAYTKVISAPADWSGDYILVYESGSYIFDGSLTNPNTMGNIRNVTISNLSVPYAKAHNYRVTVSKRSDGTYSLRTASGIYIGCTGSYSGLSYGASDQYSNRITMNTDGTVTVTASNGFRLGCFSALKQFRYFSGTSGYSAIALYRRADTALITLYTTELPYTPDSPTVDEAITIRHSLNLASDISINYAVSTSQLADYDSFYLECVLPIYEGTVLTSSRTVTVDPILNGSYYYFTLTGITAVNMNDTIQATLHMEKGGAKYTSPEDLYSIATYAYSQLDKTTSSKQLRTLCAELLRYGSSAQTYKVYRTDALVDNAMTDTHLSYLSDLETVAFSSTNTVVNDLATPSVTWAGKSLNLESKVSLRFIINATGYTGDPTKLNLHVTYTDRSGSELTVTVKGCTVYDSSRSYYSFSFDGLLAAELRSELSVAVYEGNTRISQTLEYNAATYGSNKTGALRALCQALFAYSDAAKAQFS